MMKFLPPLFIAFALLFSIGSITFAQGWLTTGELENAEQIHTLIEGQEGCLFAGTDSGIFRSTDNGASWDNVLGSDINPILAASDSTLYAGQDHQGRIFKSLDNGASWLYTSEIPEAWMIQALAEGVDGAIYAGLRHDWYYPIRSQVYKTTDGGDTWIPTSPTPGATEYDESITSLVVSSDGTLILGIDDPGRIYASTDSGDSWILKYEDSVYDRVYTLIAAPGNDLYAGVANGDDPLVLRSVDGGDSWYATAQIESVSYIKSFALTSQGVLFAGGGYWGEVFFTQDDGDSWHHTGDFHHAGIVQTLLATSENEVFAGTYLTGQVFRFTDGCEIDDQAYPEGATHPGTTCMVCDPSQNINRWSYNPEGNCLSWLPTGEMDGVEEIHMLREFSDHALWAATGPNGQVFRSEDDGDTWLTTPYLSASEDVNCLLEASDGAIYAGTAPYGNVFKTTDYGESWIGTGALGGMDTINALAEDADGAIYAIGDWALYKTVNGGLTWESIRRVLANDFFIASDGKFCCCWDDLVCLTSDPGQSWGCTQIDDAYELFALIKTSDGTFYTGGREYYRGYYGVVFRSLNEGQEWELVGDSSYTRNIYSVNSLLEVSGGEIFAGTYYNGEVYSNEPGTDSWIITHDLEEAENVRALFQTVDGTIWAGTSPHGDVFKSCNGCAIDGVCWLDGEENPSTVCEVCNTSLHTTQWSHNGAGCYIDGACFAEGQVHADHECLFCDSVNSPLDWSVYTDQCFIEGQCWSDSQVNPDDTCEYCDSDQAIRQWTFDGSGCYIDGQCHAHGDANPENICEICNSFFSWSQWTANDGVTCDDGRFCTVEDTCMDFDCDGVPRDCADSVSCTLDSCNEDTDTCDHLEDHAVCSDGQWCNGEEICDAALGCVEGAPVECDDGFFCSGLESCDEEQDICVATGNPCEEDQECFEKTDECREAVEVCWEELGELEGADNIRAILENDEGILFAGSGSTPGRLHRSTDSGQNWTELSFPETPTLFVDALAMGPGGYLYAGADGHVHRSPDNGESWEDLIAFHNTSGIVSFLNASNGFHAVTGDPLGRIYRTVNEGQTWGIVFENELGHSRGMIQHADLSFSVLSYPNLVFRSPTGEPPWSSTEVEGAKRLLQFMETSYGSMVGVGSVVNAKYFYRSMDHWESWVRVELDGLISSMNDIIEANDGTLYIAGMKYEGGSCVIRSTDHGLTWRRTQDLGDSHSVFVLYQTVSGDIFAGTGNDGAFFRLSFDCPGDDDDDDTGDDDTGDDDTGDDDTGDDDTGDDDTGDDDTGDDDTGDDDTGDDDTGDDDTGDDDTGDDDTGDDDTGDDDTGDDDTGDDDTGDDDTGDDDTGDDDTGDDDTGDDDTGDDDTGDDDTGDDDTGDDTGDDEPDKNDDDEGGCW